MMSFLEIVVFILEIIGTVVFSISGGLVGIERGLDYFGIPVLSMTTAVGGGMLRDLILGNTPPSMFTNPVYVAVAIVTSSLMLLMLHHYGNFVENGKVVSFMGPINFSTRWDWESSPSSGSTARWTAAITTPFWRCLSE